MSANAQFYCAQCQAPAVKLTLTDSQQLVQEGFTGVSTETISVEAARRLAQVIAAKDAKALFYLDVLWAPFYCPTCDRVYCRDHWLMIPQFDDDFPGWYDCTYGTCPHGHRRLVDD